MHLQSFGTFQQGHPAVQILPLLSGAQHMGKKPLLNPPEQKV